MKARTLLLIPALASLSFADTIRMRNGTEYEGEVVSEKDDHYVIMVQVTKSIRDERKVPKSEILEIVAEKKDEIAFESIKSMVPTPDLLTLAQYDSQTEDVDAFMKEFPKSKLLKEADAILKVLDAERKVVAQGGLKFEGKMIEGSEREARAFPLDAHIAASKVTSRGNAGDITGALRAWTELESKFTTSQAYIETIPYAKKMMTSHLRSVSQSLATFDKRMKDREDGLARIDERDRERTTRAIAAESAAYKAKLAKEKEQKLKWPSLDANHKEPLAETKRLLETELGKLDRLDVAKLPDGDKAWNDAWEILSGNVEPAEATSAIAAARSARLPTEYLDILQAKAPAK